MVIRLEVSVSQQIMKVFDGDELVKQYQVSTGKNGVGEMFGSEQTPRGKHVIRAKIGRDQAANSVFVGRRPTGEIFDASLQEKFPGRDWILTRIFWLSGLEKGKNRLGKVDTMRRYVYIHGTPDSVRLGVPGSRGCIRMRNVDIIELFTIVPVGTEITIFE